MELTGPEAGDDEGGLGVGGELRVGESVGEAALTVGMEAGLRVEQDDDEGSTSLWAGVVVNSFRITCSRHSFVRRRVASSI